MIPCFLCGNSPEVHYSLIVSRVLKVWHRLCIFAQGICHKDIQILFEPHKYCSHNVFQCVCVCAPMKESGDTIYKERLFFNSQAQAQQLHKITLTYAQRLFSWASAIQSPVQNIIAWHFKNLLSFRYTEEKERVWCTIQYDVLFSTIYICWYITKYISPKIYVWWYFVSPLFIAHESCQAALDFHGFTTVTFVSSQPLCM